VARLGGGVVTRVVVEVPDRYLFRLTDRAEASDMTVAEYLLRAGLTVAGISAKRETTLAKLHELGQTDAEIARYLNTTNAAVAQQRRRLGLPANRASTRGRVA
jgi:DNA-binding NarL/FixJ family response regulator